VAPQCNLNLAMLGVLKRRSPEILGRNGAGPRIQRLNRHPEPMQCSFGRAGLSPLNEFIPG
jgi:hypothetical protein